MGVQDDVDDGAGGLGEHGIERTAGGLEGPLQCDLEEHAERAHTADHHVALAVVHDPLDVRLDGEVQAGTGQADDCKHQKAEGTEEQSIHRGAVRLGLVALAQALGQQGVDAHTGAHRHGDHQILHRKGQRHGVQRILAQLCHKDAVHHIVKRLDQHGYDNGDRHGQQQPVFRHDPHFVFLRLVFCTQPDCLLYDPIRVFSSKCETYLLYRCIPRLSRFPFSVLLRPHKEDVFAVQTAIILLRQGKLRKDL